MSADLLLRQRHALIQQQLAVSGRVLAGELAAQFDISEDTIRRDLRMLAAAGLCERVYGGALSIQPAVTTLAQRMAVEPQRKAALAQAAVPFILPGMTVFIDAGSTNLAIARALPEELEAVIATNTPVIAAALMEKSGIEVILIGGRLDRQAGAAIGARALRDAELLRPDLCILGACGIDAEAGVTTAGFDDAEFKRCVAQSSKTILAAVLREKLGQRAAHAVVPLSSCAHLVVEHDTPLPAVAALRTLCRDVVIAHQPS